MPTIRIKKMLPIKIWMIQLILVPTYLSAYLYMPVLRIQNDFQDPLLALTLISDFFLKA